MVSCMDAGADVRRQLESGARLRLVRCRVLFFFQAEDGIRDYKVTGVQTCALPIFLLQQSSPRSPDSVAESINKWRVRALLGGAGGRGADRCGLVQARHRRSLVAHARSGERRVGEECRSRWSPDHLKKKRNGVGV